MDDKEFYIIRRNKNVVWKAMKNLWIAMAILIAFVVGYSAGNLIPFTGFAFAGKSIEGTAKLEVKLVLDNGMPIPKIEVDVADKTGPPPKGGVAVTDDNGVATFNIKPGSYVIYFNLGTFPKNLDWPQGGPVTSIQVSDGAVNQKILVLKAKKGS